MESITIHWLKIDRDVPKPQLKDKGYVLTNIINNSVLTLRRNLIESFVAHLELRLNDFENIPNWCLR